MKVTELAVAPDDGVERLIWKLENARPQDGIFHVTRDELDSVRRLKTAFDSATLLIGQQEDEMAMMEEEIDELRRG